MLKLSVNQKVGVLAVISSAILLAFGGVVYIEFETNVDREEQLLAVSTASSNHMEADMMHDALRGDVLTALLAGLQNDAETSQKTKSELDDHVATFRQAIDSNSKLNLDAKVKETLANILPPLESYVSAAAKIVNTAATDPAAAQSLMPEFTERFEDLENKMAETSDLIAERSKTMQEAAAEGRSNFWRNLTAGIVGSLILIAITGLLVARSIPKAFLGLVQRLADGSKQIDSASGHVATSSESLAVSTSEQAAALEETSSTLEEISSMTRHNADNSTKAKTLASEMREAAESGSKDMGSMAHAVSAIKESSDNIAKIIHTIDEIAFQTNILALNAAVEAARAGEAGLGFAVVAEEVRNLALRSASAARETANKIEDSIQKSAAGVEINSKVSKSLGHIVEKARQVDDLITLIAASSEEQRQGISQLNSMTAKIDRMTQSNAAAAEESSQVASDLKSHASGLSKLINELMTLVGGHSKSKSLTTSRANS